MILVALFHAHLHIHCCVIGVCARKICAMVPARDWCRGGALACKAFSVMMPLLRDANGFRWECTSVGCLLCALTAVIPACTMIHDLFVGLTDGKYVCRNL